MIVHQHHKWDVLNGEWVAQTEDGLVPVATRPIVGVAIMHLDYVRVMSEVAQHPPAEFPLQHILETAFFHSSAYWASLAADWVEAGAPLSSRLFERLKARAYAPGKYDPAARRALLAHKANALAVEQPR